MLDTPTLEMSKAAFLDWADGREGRCELVAGRIEMMVGASRAHQLITSNIVLALNARLDRSRWTVLADFGVDVGPATLRYPDVLVDAAGGSWKDFTALAPVLVTEVLSPSSISTDLGDKAKEYLRLESLEAYAVFSQDECVAWAWVKGSAGFPAAPQILRGPSAAVELPALGLQLPLSDVYANLDLG